MVLVVSVVAIPGAGVLAPEVVAAKEMLLAIGPFGWVMLGKSECSWTCWKKIIHDESDSNEGVPLSYILEHEKVKSVSNYEDHHIVENIWGEKFKICYVKLPNGDIAAHAE